MTRLYRLLVLTFSLTYAFSSAHADFVLLSQNTLHLGYKSKAVGPGYIAAKVGYLKSDILPNADINLLQEVMRQTDPTDFAWNAGGDTYTFWPTTAVQNFWPNRKGFNRYKEAYMTVAKTNKVDILCYGSLDNTVMQNYGKGSKLIRPPDVMLVRSKGSANITWVLNYHAIFGNKQDRYDEADGIADYIVKYLTQIAPNATAFGCPGTQNTKTDRVVVAGDWNLSQTELASSFPGTHFNIFVADADLTSLNANGDLSSNYDHFIATTPVVLNGVGVFAPAAGTFPACPAGVTGTYCGFRTYVSDHLGVKVNVVD